MASASCLVTPLQLISERFRKWIKRDKRRPKSCEKSKHMHAMLPAKTKELNLDSLLEALEMGSSLDTSVSMARTSSFKKTPNDFDYDEEDPRCQDTGITESELMPSDQAEQQECIDIYRNDIDGKCPFEVDHLQFAHEACVVFENGPLVECDAYFVFENKTLIEAEHHAGLMAQSLLTAKFEFENEHLVKSEPLIEYDPTCLVLESKSFLEAELLVECGACLTFATEPLSETELLVECDSCLNVETESFVESDVCSAFANEPIVETEVLVECDARMEFETKSFSDTEPLIGPMAEISNFFHDRIAQPDAEHGKPPNLKKAKSLRDRVFAITNKERFLYFSEMILILWNELCPIYRYKSTLPGTYNLPEPFPKLDIQPFSEVAGPVILMEESY